MRIIPAIDIIDGKWIPRFFPTEAIHYLESLEKQGEFGHFIWPYHCLIGSRGAAIDHQIMEALIDWTRDGKYYNVLTKGTNPLTEHFGIFRANIPIPECPETQLNLSFIQTFEKYQNVFLAGEAKSHCIANSLKQAMEEAPLLARKVIVLEDCMSDVAGLGHLGTPIFEKARIMGIRFGNSADYQL